MTMTQIESDSSRREIRQSLVIAAAVLGFAAIVSALSPEYVTEEWVQRLVGAITGALVVFYGNAAAKKLTPLGEMRHDPVAEQSLRRFTAWSITLGGLGYTLAWLVAPWSSASLIAVAVLGTSVLLVTARWIGIRATGPRP